MQECGSGRGGEMLNIYYLSYIMNYVFKNVLFNSIK